VAPPGVSFEDLMRDALILARNEGADVFNALDLMHNSTMLESLKFGPGDGILHYYFYNYRCPLIKPEQLGLVLL
jgi:glycylpeptide N-tetradecanoyltransferase